MSKTENSMTDELDKDCKSIGSIISIQNSQESSF